LPYHYNRKTFRKGKQQNQQDLRNHFHLADGPPLISFIGRLVLEKGADLIPDLVRDVLDRGLDVVFLMLGTGSPEIERMFEELNHAYPGRFFAKLEYNESLAHQIYAGSDFILMPSRVEPCGLNQMYAMRYGTIPIVRATGGLADTVKDISLEGGYGLVFDQFSKEEALRSLERALELFQDKKRFDGIRREIMAFDFSWEASAGVYQEMYRSLLKLAGTP
jgi:starch synthase